MKKKKNPQYFTFLRCSTTSLCSASDDMMYLLVGSSCYEILTSHLNRYGWFVPDTQKTCLALGSDMSCDAASLYSSRWFR